MGSVLFCEECRKDVNYTTHRNVTTAEVRGQKIEFVETIAKCITCGCELDHEEYEELNFSAIDKKFREMNGIVTIEEIEELMEKYNIKKQPLSLVLGFGIHTITQWLGGQMPQKVYSDVFVEAKEPEIFKQYLEENREKLTDGAYSRTLSVVNKLIENNITNKLKKIDVVAKIILSKNGDTTPLALQKLLYYSQAFTKVFTNQFLFEDDCEAWVHGPVYKDVYHEYKCYGCKPIKEDNQIAYQELLTSKEMDIVNVVIKSFGCYSGRILEAMTHGEKPWLIARGDLKSDEISNNCISKDLIEEYFLEVKNKFNILGTNDIADYSMDMFKKIIVSI